MAVRSWAVPGVGGGVEFLEMLVLLSLVRW
jgi:hypothetical protein